MLQNEEFIHEFIEEARGHVEKVESNLLNIAQNQEDIESINELFRCVHSIKGTAGFFGLQKIVKLSHTMENLFGEMRSGKIQMSDLIIDILLSANDRLREMIENPAASDDMDINDCVSNISAIVNGELLQNIQEQDISQKSQQEEDNAKKGPSITVEDSIRVHVNLLNDLMNLASELVLGRNQLLRALDGHYKNIPGLEPILQNVDHITTELQERIMQTRMQPIGNVFNKFPRLIRELSKELKKEIKLEMSGTDVELDKSIIESLADPITHLIRNAADHGIEPPEERIKVGKERTGIISLKAYHEGGHVVIDIKDDGAGINEERLKQKAVEKGLIQREDIGSMDQKDILEMIFLPGFSTASKLTDISGRGVGMDVVKTNIEKLGGTVEIFTQKGKGSTFRLNLPLTLAIISSIIVEVKGQKFALPQVNLQEMVRIKPGDTERRIEYIHGARVLRLRNKLLPLVELSEVLGLSEAETAMDCSSAIIRVLVLKIGSRRFGLIVDAINDEEEILVKPLPHYLKDCRVYSGVTILGDGGIAMILDPEGIAAVSELKFTDGDGDDVKGEEAKEVHSDKQEMLLMFKCSGPETFGVYLSMISRVEEIRFQDIQTVGDGEYMEFRGRAMRLIRPEDYLPVKKGDLNGKKLYVIVPKHVEPPLGIIVDKVYDAVLVSAEFNQKDIKAEGILGTTFWNGKIVLVLDLYGLLGMADKEYSKLSIGPGQTAAN